MGEASQIGAGVHPPVASSRASWVDDDRKLMPGDHSVKSVRLTLEADGSGEIAMRWTIPPYDFDAEDG